MQPILKLISFLIARHSVNNRNNLLSSILALSSIVYTTAFWNTNPHCLYSKSNKEEVTIKIKHSTLICIEVALIWAINHSAPYLVWPVIGIRGKSGPPGTTLRFNFGPKIENLCGNHIFWATFIFGTKNNITKFLDLIY